MQEALIQGQGMCGTFNPFNLTYLHVLRAGIVYIYKGMWTYQGTCTYLGSSRGMCMYHRVIYRLTLYASTNVPLSSARLPTTSQQPLHASWACLKCHHLKQLRDWPQHKLQKLEDNKNPIPGNFSRLKLCFSFVSHISPYLRASYLHQIKVTDILFNRLSLRGVYINC